MVKASLPCSILLLQGALQKPLPRNVAELSAKASAAKYGCAHPVIDLCNQEFMGRPPNGRLMIPSGCTLKNGTILLTEDEQVSSVFLSLATISNVLEMISQTIVLGIGSFFEENQTQYSARRSGSGPWMDGTNSMCL